MERFAAILLAGGEGRRLGGIDKSALAVGGRSMRERVLAAVADAEVRVVVGPAMELPAEVVLTREDPPGGGPVAAIAAGLALLDQTAVTTVALLAADLPLLTRGAIDPLRRALAASGADGVCYLDNGGRRQRLCGVWRLPPLQVALRHIAVQHGGRLAGASMGELQSGLTVVEVGWVGSGAPPWFDCDTPDDVRRAEQWLREEPS